MIKYDFFIYQNQALTKRFLIKEIDGSPSNLTGYSLTGKVKKNFSDNNFLLDLSPNIFNATQGIIQFSLDSQETKNLPIGEFLYDIHRFSDSLNKEILVAGKIKILPSVTI
jgi:hypothetical protein